MEIRKMTAETAHLLWTVEDRRLDSEQVVIRPQKDGFALEYRPMPGALWRLQGEKPNVPGIIDDWIVDPDMDALFVFEEGKLVAELFISRYEESLARIWDVRVMMSRRRKGIAAALLDEASRWAQERALGGLIAQVDDANAAACQFFTSCAFQLGGVDMLRYVASHPGTKQAAGLRESALFFYRFLS